MVQHIKPPLGEIIRLHQAYEGTVVCLYCGKPIKEWMPMEKCPAPDMKKELVNNK